MAILGYQFLIFVTILAAKGMSRKAMWLVVGGWTLFTLFGPIFTFWLTLLQLGVIAFSVLSALSPDAAPPKAASAPPVPPAAVSPPPPPPPAPLPAARPFVAQPLYVRLPASKPKLRLRWVFALAILFIAAAFALIHVRSFDDALEASRANVQTPPPRNAPAPKPAAPNLTISIPVQPSAEAAQPTRRARAPVKANDLRHCLALASDEAMSRCAETAR